MTKFCCKGFPSKKNGRSVSFYPDERTNKIVIEYYLVWREYQTVHGNIGFIINYCPWCGTKLPKGLSDEWYDTLEKEHGISDPIVDDRSKVPSEFWTEEWWKKRGL